MKNDVSISVITATRNCFATLKDNLESFSKQDYQNSEHIIIDGASNDGTVELIQQNLDQLSVFLSEPDSGIYDALNKGISLAKGDIIGFLHADDIYASNVVLTNIAMAFRDPAVSAVYGDLEYVRRDNLSDVIRRWNGKTFNKRDLGWGWMPAHPTLYVRRSCYLNIEGFDVNYRIAADYLSILKLFTDPCFKSIYLPEVFVKMRLGGASNKSISAIIVKSSEDWRALRSCNFSILSSIRVLLAKNLRKIPQFIF